MCIVQNSVAKELRAATETIPGSKVWIRHPYINQGNACIREIVYIDDTLRLQSPDPTNYQLRVIRTREIGEQYWEQEVQIAGCEISALNHVSDVSST